MTSLATDQRRRAGRRCAALATLCWLVGSAVPALAQDAPSATTEHADGLASPASAPDDGGLHGDSTSADPAAEPGSATPRLSSEQGLNRARNLFAYGDYPQAAELLSELVLPGRLASEQDLIDAHRMLGIALFLTKRRAEARRAFMALLYLAPDTRLDPFLTPPSAVEFFDSVAAEIADQLDAVRAKQAERERQKPVPTVTVVERTVRRRPWAASLVPLGYPQFDRGAWGPGLFFLGSQALGVGTLAVTAFSAYALTGDGALPRASKPLYDGLRIANWTAAGLTLAAYAGGVIEAALAHQPETLERATVEEVPADRVSQLAAPPADKE